MTRRSKGQADTILIGSSDAVHAAHRFIEAHAPRLRVQASVLIGPGEAPVPVAARAATWDALKFPAVDAEAVVLAEMPPAAGLMRALMKQAVDARLNVHVFDHDALRAPRIDDLVGRKLGAMDWKRIGALIEGRRVMITGGGGSIGGELARRIAKLAPARLTLLDSSEFNLYNIAREAPDAALALADIRDVGAIKRWFAREKPELVFHAAALKQVPLVEAFPCEGVLTNVSGLRHVAEAARAVGADLIFVSTDKAVDPSGVMGASKRLGELYCQALDRQGGRRTLPVRLGNVLGSAGSVTPLFEAQLAAGGPLTVTDAEVTRFFISIPQAADVLLQAAAVGFGTDATRGAALTIDMGEALPVVELARDIIRLAGLRPDVDVPITFVGLRPGEKLHEQLVGADEWREADPTPGVIAAGSAPRSLADLLDVMDRLALLARAGADAVVVAALLDAVAPAAADQAGAVSRAFA